MIPALICVTLVILISINSLIIIGLKKLKTRVSIPETIVITLYIISINLFFLGLSIHSTPYTSATDPVDFYCYSPFSTKSLLTLLVYFLAFNGSIVLIWVKGRQLPPLTLSLALSFTALGIIIMSGFLLQLSQHNTQVIGSKNCYQEILLLSILPAIGIFIGCKLIYQIIKKEIDETNQRQYTNKFLNSLNSFLAKRSKNPFWILLLMIPVYLVITLILILFGQDPDALINAFTDTATWRFSEHIPPVLLNHQGHYLCTVAATGHPKIVKPIRIGKRHGRKIIVNRQLPISNAFEELISDFSPKLHSIIRKNYDKYGLNLSKKINTQYRSTITYICMKPIEWGFLICLYLFCVHPEQKIKSQYAE